MTEATAPEVDPPVERRSRRPLVGLLTAQAISLTGTSVTAIALPWFVLVSTGSALQTGLVAFCQMAPYVVSKALMGPVVDQIGARTVNVVGGVTSAVVVGSVPVLHMLGALPFGVLLALVALGGIVLGPTDASKEVLLPTAVEAAGVPLERGTGLSGSIERLAGTLGPMAAGGIVAWVGPLSALVLDALSFALAAGLIAWTMPKGHHADAERGELVAGDGAGGYLTRLREGFDFLRGEPLLRSIVGMVAVTNLIDAAFAGVLLPVWAKQTGGGPAMIGLLGSLTGAFAIGGSLLAAWLAERLPRRATYLVGYFVAGAPRFVVLALDAPLWLTLGVFAVGGFGAGFINPIIGAVFYERVPRAMLGRTNALADAIAWAGIPFGGLAAGVLIGVMGLGPTFLVLGGAYLITTTLPGLRREWATMNRTAAHGK